MDIIMVLCRDALFDLSVSPVISADGIQGVERSRYFWKRRKR